MAEEPFTGVSLQSMKEKDKKIQLNRLQNTLASIDHELKNVRSVLKCLIEIEKERFQIKVEPKLEERKPYSQDE